MKNTGIYLIRNKVNNNIYIGSAINISNRKKTHLHQLKYNIHHCNYLQRSFNKHGKDNFIFEILEYCEKDKLIEREQHFINILNPRYNICRIAGSSLGVKRNNETKKKLSESHKGQKAWNKGIPATKEQKEKQSLIMKNRISNSKGIKWNKESRLKLSNSKKGKPAANKIPIYQYNSITREFINQFESITEAQLLTNTKGIYQVLKGRCKTANNFLWSKQKHQYLPI
jgi:group I intron endonuclease